jgi:hypothetical protein
MNMISLGQVYQIPVRAGAIPVSASRRGGTSALARPRWHVRSGVECTMALKASLEK